MNPMHHHRLDPSLIAPEELEALATAFARPGHIALIDDEGRRIEIPAPLFQHLARLVRLMAEQRAVILIPEDETFTTQAAANYLGVSRQHLVNLLEDGPIAFHKVGSHRRVYFRDLLAYEKQRDKERRAALDGLMKKIDDADFYDAAYTGDHES